MNLPGDSQGYWYINVSLFYKKYICYPKDDN